MAYFFIVLIMTPSYYYANGISYRTIEDDWVAQRYKKGFVHLLILLLLTIFTGIVNYSDEVLFYLMEMWNDDNDNCVENNLDKIKSKSISMGNQSVNVQIKLNKALYLKDQFGQNCEFRQILLENVRNDFIYIKTENKAVDNMLSISCWKYPNMDPVINYLKPIAKLIYGAIFIIYLPLLFHIKDQPAYVQLKEVFKITKFEKVKFIPIFKIVGAFENGVTVSRFVIFLIILIILELFRLKRYLLGGFSTNTFLTLFYALSIIALILIIIYLILSLLIVVFSILSILTLNDYKKAIFNTKDMSMLLVIFILQIILNVSVFGEIVKPALSRLTSIIKYLGLCKNELEKLYNPEMQGNTDYQFVGLDMLPHKLNEVIIGEGYPRFLFYALADGGTYVVNNANPKNAQNNNINNIGVVSEETVLKLSVKKHE